MNNWIEKLESEREALEIHQLGVVPVEKIVISDQVRELCKANACGHYGKSWACPPGVGTLEECREKIMKFQHMLVFTTKHDLEDSFDFEGMMDGKAKHEEICEKVLEEIKRLTDQPLLVLSAEGCKKCSTCTYPSAPCRFPDKLFPSVESFGIEVNKLAAAAGVKYINGVNTVTYFAGICY